MDMNAHRYAGLYKSGIVRAKKILLAAGFPWSTTTGRYHPFANQQRTSDGVKVTRVGCSGTIALHVHSHAWTYGNKGARDDVRWIEALAIATLRDAGMPFDDRGWLECQNDY